MASVKKNVLLVCGTRPEIIKMAPVYSALLDSKTLAPAVLHTGQHTDLATPLYDFFDMPPTESIDLQRSSGHLADLSSALLTQISQALVRLKPQVVLVHGDTSSSVMAALAAFYEQIPVGHVEAGLRTHDKYSPFPEEMNRCLTGRLADWHYAPTERSAQSLRAEGIAAERIIVTGNTVIDAAQQTAARQSGYKAPDFIVEQQLAQRLQGHRLVLVTAHRRENWGAGLEQIATAVSRLLQTQPDTFVVWPLHANPAVAQAVRQTLERTGADSARLVLAPPLDYPALIWLLRRAWVTLTDSGGIQEEAAALGTPVLVLRDSTERPELIEAGGGVLVGANTEAILAWTHKLSTDAELLASMRNIRNPFGDGSAGVRIRRHLEGCLALPDSDQK